MTNTNANVAPKKAQLTIIAVGREGKMRVCRMRPDVPNAKASNAMFDVPAGKTLRQALMTLVSEEIVKASEAFKKAGHSVAIEVYTVGQIAIKYYQMVPYLKGGNFMTDADIEAISSERDTTEDLCAYDDLAQAVAKVTSAGNTVHLQASGNAKFLELILPEGVEVYDGQVLDFTDGATVDGVTVRGWSKCNRKGVKAVVRGQKNPRAYIHRAADPEKPWRGLETLLKTIDGCWNSLPKAAVDKSNDDGISEEELYSA